MPIKILKLDKNKDYKIKEVMDLWFKYQAPRNLRESTIITDGFVRKRALKVFPEIENFSIKDLSTFEFQQLLDHMVEDYNYSKSSVKQVKNLYSKVFRFARIYGLSNINPIKDSEILSKAKSETILGLSQSTQKNVERIIEKLAFWRQSTILFLLYTGVRKKELINLKWEDWDRDEEIILIHESKTDNGVRAIPLSSKTSLLLYLIENKNKKRNDKYIFCDKYGNQLTKGKIQYMFTLIKKDCRINKVTPHIMRHTFASRMVENGMNIKALSQMLGHKNFEFTYNRYVNTDMMFLKEEINRCAEK